MNIHTRIIRSTTAATHARTASAVLAAGANVNADLNIIPPPPPPPPPSKLTFDSASRSVRLPFFRQVHSSKVGRKSSIRRLVIVLLAGVFSLLAVPASAQTTTVWSATFTVGTVNTELLGCNLKSDCDSKLTNNSFTVGGTNYHFTGIYDNNSGTRSGQLNILINALPNTALKALKFCVGSTEFSLSGAAGIFIAWPNANLPWATGNTISLSIGSSCPTATTPTVNLSAAPNPVPEGSSVTITATLSAALTSNVRIPLTITRGSAEAADIGSLAAITISSGQTSATGSLSTNQDTDEQDETLTVALGTLPSSVTAGTDNSVAITITDDDKPAPTDLTALTAQRATSSAGPFTALALNPATFSHTTTAYSASVTNAVTHLILTPTAAQSGATIRVGKSGNLNSVASGVDSSAIPLSVGANPILVEVTASGGAKNTYTVSITRAAPSGSGQSDNADLSALTAKSSTDGSTFTTLALTPSFSASTTAYRAPVGNEVTHAILTPTTAHNAASIKVGKSGSLTAVNSGSDSSAISLAEGGNAIVVEVTAEDGSTTNYRVSITRAAIPTTLTLAASPTDIPEGRESVVTATLNRPAPSGGSVVTLTIDASGNTAATEGVDYSLTTKTFTIAAGRHSETVTLTTIADEVDDDGETITISATSTNPSLRTERALVLTIVSQIQSERLHETALPEVARAVASRVTGAISTRVGRALNGSGSGGVSASLGGQSSLAGVLQTHAPGLVNDNIPLRDLLDGSDFVLPFHTREEGGGLRKTSLWGSGEYRNLSGENDGVDFDGSLYGAQIGVDHKVRENLLAGVALSWSEGELEYEDTSESGGASGVSKGDYEIDLLAIHPYFGWRSGQRHWWATAGYGTGEVEITPQDGESSSNDVTLQSVSLGGSGLLWSRDDASVRLKGEIARTDLEVEKTAQVAAMTVETTLIRFAAEASSSRHLSGGGHLSPSISLGLRHDGGDGVDGNTSTGAEFHGSVRYANPKTGWNAETSAHTLLGRSDYEEWGIQASLRLSPSAGGHGLSFEMSPGYGNHGGDGNTGQIWSNGLRETTPTTHDPSGRLEMNLGYGLSTPGERDGLLTPWSGLTLQDNGKLYRIGLDWSSGGQFTLRLHGERREHGNERADADHAILLKGEARF